MLFISCEVISIPIDVEYSQHNEYRPMTSSLIRKYDVIIVISMLEQLKKRKVFIVSLFLDGLS